MNDAPVPTHHAYTSGHFTPDDLIWQVQREAVLMLGGGRAFLMQASHPRALAGFAQHTDYQSDPFARLWRTMDTVWTGVFGTPEQAERAGAKVRAIHSRVRGELTESAGPFAAGTAYSADDPELLMWVHATLYDTSLLMYQMLVRPLDDAQRDLFYEQMKAQARLFGTPDDVIPPTRPHFEQYMREMLASDHITVCDLAREMGSVILDPPVGRASKLVWPLINTITTATLPAKLREGFGLAWSPRRQRAFDLAMRAARLGLIPLVPPRLRVLRVARFAERQRSRQGIAV